MLPFSIFEEIKHCKAILNTIVVNQILQQLWICAQDEERAKEPAVIETEKTLLYVTWILWVSLHLGILIR